MHRRTLTAGVVAGAAGLLLSAVSALGTATTEAAVTVAGHAQATAHRSIHWDRCQHGVLKRAHAQCGRLEVPLDHAHPDGRTISIAVSRVLHTGKRDRGALFTNPGGPGAAGRFLALFGPAVPGGVGRTYDWYGIDVRGAGASRPALSCDPHYFHEGRPQYEPRSKHLVRRWQYRSDGYAADCADSPAAELLPHLRTTDTVADLEDLRRAIGVRKVSFYGFSGGTNIAQVYATEHPRRLKRVVMDGVADPRIGDWRAQLDQDGAYDANFGRFLAWIGRYPQIFHLGRGERAVRQRWHRVHARLAREPVGRFGVAELDDSVLPATYGVLDYEGVAHGLSALVNRHDARGLERIYRQWNPTGPRADNGYAGYLGTLCTDSPWPDRWSRWMRVSRRVHRHAPTFTWMNTWYDAPCRAWPAPSGERVHVDGKRLHAPVLLLNEQHDAATPYSGAVHTRALFPTSRLVEGVGGVTHAASLSGGRCTDTTVARFLAHGTLPRRRPGNQADKRCPGLPRPDPTAHGRPATSHGPAGQVGRPIARSSGSAASTVS